MTSTIEILGRILTLWEGHFRPFQGQKTRFLEFFKVALDLFRNCLSIVFGFKRPSFCVFSAPKGVDIIPTQNRFSPLGSRGSPINLHTRLPSATSYRKLPSKVSCFALLFFLVQFSLGWRFCSLLEVKSKFAIKFEILRRCNWLAHLLCGQKKVTIRFGVFISFFTGCGSSRLAAPFSVSI